MLSDFGAYLATATKQTFSDEYLAKHKIFEESGITIDDYIATRHTFKSIDEHKDMLVKCVALVGTKFVIRKSEDIAGCMVPFYKLCSRKELFDSILNSVIKFEETQTETTKSGTITKQIIIEHKPINWLNDVEFQGKLAHYDTMSLVSYSHKILQKFIPASIKNDEHRETQLKMAKYIIDLFSSMVDDRSKKSWEEEVFSIAYKVQHLSEFICKFFVHYGEGDNGKSLWCKFISWMFPGCSNPGISDNQSESRFNGYLCEYLFEWFEEIENENYQNRKFETFIKRITTETISSEKKGVDPKADLFRSLIGMSTNQSDLYGLVRSHHAVQTRLVPIYFSKSLTQEEWQNVLKPLGVERGNPNKIHNQYLVGAALWEYFKQMQIPSTYYPDRCNNPQERDELFEFLRGKRATGPDKFMLYLNESYNAFDRVKGQRGSRKDKIFIRIREGQLKELYRKYMREEATGIQQKLAYETIINRLIELKFEIKHPQGYKTYELDEESWQKYLSNYDTHEDEINNESDDDILVELEPLAIY